MIEVQRLSKAYGSFRAVDDVSFSCKPGAVTGFLGPNGAGKSTTMRLITGLTIPDAGTSTVLGVPYSQIGNPARHVGVLLDASAQHAGRSGREILALAAQTMGLPTSRADQMLELVGLDGTEAKRKVRNYSLGMRQRLGIASALMGDPKVLILDEPANGLDPAGIRWMRGLLREYADRGGTVLLSSHLLHEVQQIADELIVIGNGRIVAQGSQEQLLHASGTFAKAADPAKLAQALNAAGISASQQGEGVSAQADAPTVGLAAFNAGIPLTELRTADGEGLEELFLQLTADNQRDALPTPGAHA